MATNPFSPTPSLSDTRRQLVSQPSAEAQQIVDALIAQTKDYIQSLKSIRNENARISALPNEDLVAIFTEAVAPLTDFDAVTWEDHIQVTAVCRLWRDVCYHCPELWTCMAFRS